MPLHLLDAKERIEYELAVIQLLVNIQDWPTRTYGMEEIKINEMERC